jgi:putative selenate reductase FAD-binding subunit
MRLTATDPALAPRRQSPYNPIMIVEIKRPKTVSEAVREKSAPATAYLGGGTWLNAHPGEEPVVLISLENLGLDGISSADGRYTIGSAVTFQQIVEADGIPPALGAASALCGSRTLRNMLTLGGELGVCPDDSALIAVLVALDAGITLAGRRKPIAIEDFLGDRSKDLILSVVVEPGDRRCRVSAVARTSHSPRSLVIAVSARVVSGSVKDARIVVSDCVGKRVRLKGLEKELDGALLPEKTRIEELVRRAFSPGPDLHASAAYKSYLTGVLVADALHAIAGGKETP